MGNRSSWQTVSQNSTGNEAPCFLRVLKSESNALKTKEQYKRGEQEHLVHVRSQPSHFKIFSIHNDVIKAEKDWEPVLDHRVIDANVLWTSRSKTTFRRVEHDRNDASEHRDRKKADLLVLAHFAKVGDAHSQICECTISDNGRKVFLIQSRDDFERGARYPFCG